ncbi:nuclear pore complex protein NUP58-like [Pyrus communis]|uniref:nuclear pore complex protein NUP58-like n=1 Tax=Pyrus communis TaxID=23211 RepID=UPI0035C1BFB0
MAFSSLFSTAQPQQQQQQSLFQTQQASQPFQQSSSFFSQQPLQQQPPLFPQPQFQQQPLFQQPQFQQQQQQQQQQQLYLFTNEKTPASYGTKWADLHPDSQKVLLQIEERILGYRDESQRLDQCSRLCDSSVSNDAFEHDASRILQELGGIGTSMDREKAVLHELMAIVKDMLRNSEVAVRSFMILRPRFLHPNAGGTSNATAPSQAPGATVPPGSSSQPTTTSIVPVFDFYNGIPRKPSPFLQQTMARFEKYLVECRQWIEELEQLLLDSERNSANDRSSLLQSLPNVMKNVHDFFVHVAAKVESIHQYVVSMKTAYLVNQRRQGDGNDPFLEADRRETARQEAAAKRAHPTLHLSATSQPSTQVAGLFASSGTPGTSTAPQTSAATITASSGSGLFSTPSAPSASTSSSLFATPPTSGPASSLFSTPSATPQASLISSSSAFGPASTPSLFSNPTPGFSSTTPIGSSLFTSGSAGSGLNSSFTSTKSARPRSRTGGRR